MTDLATNAIVTLAQAHQRIGLPITDTDDDNRIKQIVNEVSQNMETFCRRRFKTQSYTEYFDGSGSSSIILPQHPVTSITSIYDDVNWQWSAGTLVDSDYYNLDGDSGILYLMGSYRFCSGKRNIKITYVAGYTTIPADLEGVCLEWFAIRYTRASANLFGATSKSVGDQNVSYMAELPKELVDTLKLYQLHGRQANYGEYYG